MGVHIQQAPSDLLGRKHHHPGRDLFHQVRDVPLQDKGIHSELLYFDLQNQMRRVKCPEWEPDTFIIELTIEYVVHMLRCAINSRKQLKQTSTPINGGP